MSSVKAGEDGGRASQGKAHHPRSNAGSLTQPCHGSIPSPQGSTQHPASSSQVHCQPHPMLSTGPAACPGRSACILAALEQAGQREAEHQLPQGTLPSIQQGTMSRLVAGPVPGTCLPPYLLHLFPIKASFQSIRENYSVIL